MKTTPATILAVAALVAVTGCAKKKPAMLPPPPPTAQSPAYVPPPPPTGSGMTNGAATPGSRADFIAKAGSDTVHFVTDSYDIDDEAKAVLTAQAQWLTQYPAVSVTVEGHCDERGTREYNLALGDRRANAAKNFLVAAGIAPNRIATISYGKERPLATGSDEAAWALNRRAVTVVPQ